MSTQHTHGLQSVESIHSGSSLCATLSEVESDMRTEWGLCGWEGKEGRGEGHCRADGEGQRAKGGQAGREREGRVRGWLRPGEGNIQAIDAVYTSYNTLLHMSPTAP